MNVQKERARLKAGLVQIEVVEHYRAEMLRNAPIHILLNPYSLYCFTRAYLCLIPIKYRFKLALWLLQWDKV
jgi:hypothetical protein